jgi:energy-coupling factor transporter ATP-binding protein EcfA2
MPYVSRDLLRLSLAALGKDYSPLLLVSLPCMLKRRIPTCTSVADARKRAIEFGSSDEEQWLDEYFRVRGGPPGKPYYMPGTGGRVKQEYPGKSLQRQRKAYEGTVFYHPDAPRWALRQDGPDFIQEKILGQKKQPVIPLVALMAWMWRTKEIGALDAALKEFVRTIGFGRDKLLEKVYSNVIPSDLAEAGLADSPLTEEAIAELIGAAPPPPTGPSLSDLISTLENSLQEQRYIAPAGLVQRIVGGWLVGDIVVLVGPTGSGKTSLAQALTTALERMFGKERFFQAFLEVGPDYDIAQFLGYENLAGDFSAGRFAKEALFVGEPTDPRLVILDEWNLAQIDAYFAPVLSVVESKRPMRLPGRLDLKKLAEEDAQAYERAQPTAADGQWVLPEDTFFLATCNSWADEPETRLPVSGPVKRRCRIIPMPNVLELKFREKAADAVYEVSDTLLDREREAVAARKAAGEPSVWDRHRDDRLNAIKSMRDLQSKTHEKLAQLSGLLLKNPLTKSAFTVGILRDILLSCVYAPVGGDFDALGQQVADKVLHQLQGDPKVLEVIADLSKDFQNAEEIRDLAKRMGAFAGEKRIRPLL